MERFSAYSFTYEPKTADFFTKTSYLGNYSVIKK